VVLAVAISACEPQQLPGTDTSGPQIALTFDDATRGPGPFFDGPERTQKLIAALQSADVDEAMFFVTTRNVDRQGESGVARIWAYTNAGHTLGNHSHSHQWLWRTDIDAYVADLDLAEQKLTSFESVQPFYRYPFLDEGRNVEKRDQLRQALAERDLGNGYVTVDTYDWYLEALAKEAKEAGREMDLDELRSLYVDVLVSGTEFYEAMARETLGRSPRHVLLLHENDLAALFVGDLVAELRNRGWTIIPATAAFADPIADLEPDTMFLGQGRIAALAHEAGATPASLVSPEEDEEYLQRRFEKTVRNTQSAGRTEN
jgi:peptidoglycan/xylan/chitin deacetylase (PgdA/CDA1 family)